MSSDVKMVLTSLVIADIDSAPLNVETVASVASSLSSVLTRTLAGGTINDDTPQTNAEQSKRAIFIFSVTDSSLGWVGCR